MRSTRQRDAIREVLKDTHRPLSPNELLDLASNRVPTLGIATVYRTIKLLVEEGTAIPVELPGEPARYEHREAASTPHYFFRCDVCGRVYDVDGSVDNLRTLVPGGFALRKHVMVLYGTCKDCRQKSNGS
jgi:Fur family ferric uptake transcriptional regulator